MEKEFAREIDVASAKDRADEGSEAGRGGAAAAAAPLPMVGLSSMGSMRRGQTQTVPANFNLAGWSQPTSQPASQSASQPPSSPPSSPPFGGMHTFSAATMNSRSVFSTATSVFSSDWLAGGPAASISSSC